MARVRKVGAWVIDFRAGTAYIPAIGREWVYVLPKDKRAKIIKFSLLEEEIGNLFGSQLLDNFEELPFVEVFSGVKSVIF